MVGDDFLGIFIEASDDEDERVDNDGVDGNVALLIVEAPRWRMGYGHCLYSCICSREYQYANDLTKW